LKPKSILANDVLGCIWDVFLKLRERLHKEGGKPADKPGSVVDNHSSSDQVTLIVMQSTRVQRGPRHRTPIWPCSGWSLPCHELLPVARCALTAPFHPYLCRKRPSAVCSLLHWSSVYTAQALPGTLPCGARTFLPSCKH